MPTCRSRTGVPSQPPIRVRWLWAVLGVAWMAVLFWASSRPAPPLAPTESLDFVVKQTGHFVAYALLGALWWVSLRDPLRPLRAVVLALAIAISYGIFDELHQALEPTREPSVLDVVTDAAGAVAGVWIVACRFAK